MGIPSLTAVGATVKPVTIYALVDPRDRSPFYVGATTRRIKLRLSSHINDAVNLGMRGGRYAAIREIHASGNRTWVFDLETVPHDGWVEAEQFWIANLRFMGACLTNVAIGGPGATGTRQRESTRRLRSIAAIGRDISYLREPGIIAKAAIGISKALTGKKPTPETRMKMSLARRGEGNLNWGKPRSAETRAKISAANTGRKRPTGADAYRHRAVLIAGVEYPTIRLAAAAHGKDASTIRNWLVAGKAIYADGGPAPKARPRKPAKGRARGERHGASRPVIIDDVRYWGATAAAEALGKGKATIWRWLKSGRAQYATR